MNQSGTLEAQKERTQRLREEAEKNTKLSHQEYAERKIVLESTPPMVFVQINAVCNANCVFCSKGYDYPIFKLDDWLAKYGDQVTPVLSRASQVNLTGSGEFLGLPDAPHILDYFNSEFAHVDKYVATNGSYLTPKLLDRICSGESRYSVQLSLHGSTPEMHRLMMRYRTHERVTNNIRALLERRNPDNVKVRFMFILTTLNIDDLPSFVKWAKEMGADGVVCGYFNIYEANQKYLSLYFKQDLANQKIEEAQKIAQEVGIDLSAPAQFGLAPDIYKKPSCCGEPWNQIMLNVDGHVLPCDVYGSFPREDNLNEKTFQEIWNGEAYQKIRSALAKSEGCLINCPRHNPQSINKWSSHVIDRPKEDRLVVKESSEALRRP